MAGPSIVDAIRVAEEIVRSKLELQPGEEVVVIADTYTDRQILDALAGAIAGAGGEFTIVIQTARPRPEEVHKLTRAVLRAYQEGDVIITAAGASSLSLYGSSSVLWPQLAAKKTRLFTLSEPSLRQMVEGASAADYREVEQIGLRIIRSLEGADRVRVTTALGTDITFRIGGRDLINLASFARNPGDEGGIPSGEVSTDPVAGTAEGVVIADGPIGNIERPPKPVRLVARGGQWVEVAGEGAGVERLRHYFDTVENARNVAEFALGTNQWARCTGVVSEEKKRLGVMHTAYGRSNRTADWRCEVWSKIHGDVVVYDVTVEAESKVIMRDGTLLV
ncbi:MAG: aminopeptidase [Armatimonadetes bacterium]|nr:aminopeptidase [Armatimonadota bacterium]